MDNAIHILTFFLGCALGALLAWLAARSRFGQQASAALAESSAQIARLEEFARSKSKELEEKNGRVSDLHAQLDKAEIAYLSPVEKTTRQISLVEPDGRNSSNDKQRGST